MTNYTLFLKHLPRNVKCGHYRNRYPDKCDECGKPIDFGDRFYSLKNHYAWKGKKVVARKPKKHICVACYEAKFI